MDIRTRLGLLRSHIMYYWKPLNKRRLKRFYKQFVKEGDLCFDIGAHLGNRTAAWLELGARVVAVEPQPQCIQYLKRKFSSNSDFNLLEIALGMEVGQAHLHISKLTPTISTLAGYEWKKKIQEKSSYPVSWDYTIEVPIKTLDILIEQYGMPAFTKIDVEDHEVEVLAGLSTPLPALSFEYFAYTPDRTKQCIQLLDALGTYQYNWSYGESQVLNSPDFLDSKSMLKIISGFDDNSRSGDIYAILN